MTGREKGKDAEAEGGRERDGAAGRVNTQFPSTCPEMGKAKLKSGAGYSIQVHYVGGRNPKMSPLGIITRKPGGSGARAGHQTWASLIAMLNTGLTDTQMLTSRVNSEIKSHPSKYPSQNLH